MTRFCLIPALTTHFCGWLVCCVMKVFFLSPLKASHFISSVFLPCSRPFNPEAISDMEGKQQLLQMHLCLSVQYIKPQTSGWFRWWGKRVSTAGSLLSAAHVITAVISTMSVTAHYESVKRYYQGLKTHAGTLMRFSLALTFAHLSETKLPINLDGDKQSREILAALLDRYVCMHCKEGPTFTEKQQHWFPVQTA